MAVDEPQATGAGDVFVGRDAELGALVSTVAAARSGRGSLSLIAGEPGIGKTRLLDELAARVPCAVARATCWRGDGAPGYWPWHQLLRAVGAGAGVDAPPTAATTDADARFEWFDRVADALAAVAADGSLLLVIDDLHWADAGSLRLLEFIGRDPRSRRLAIVGAYRDPATADDHRFPEAMRELVHGGVHLHLGGLDTDDVGRLAGALGADPDTVPADALRRRTAGNPLFVREVVHLLAAHGATGARPAMATVPAGVRSVVLRRLDALSPDARRAVTVGAVVGPEFDVPLVGAVLDRPTDEVWAALDEAVAAGLVHADGARLRCSFVHALVQEVLDEHLGTADRAALHGRVASAIEDRFGDARPVEVAHHAVLALAAGDDPLGVVERAVRAATWSASRLAYEQAAQWYGRALELLPTAGGTDPDEADLLLRRGEALVASGDLPEAGEAFRQAAVVARQHGDVGRLAAAALGLGAGRGGFEVPLHDGTQVSLLEEALHAIGPTPTELRVRLLARLSVALSGQGVDDRRRELGEAAVREARRIGDPAALGHALASHCDVIAGPAWSEARREAAAEIVELARGVHDPQLELLGRRLRVVALLELGEIAAADEERARFASVADRLGQPLYRWYVPLWHGMRSLMRGDVDDAARWTAEAERLGALAHSDNAAVLTFTQSWVRQRYEQRFAEAGAAMSDVLGFGPGATPVVAGTPALRLRALIATHLGELDTASGLLDRWLAAGGADTPRDAEWLAETAQLAEVAAAVGHEAVAALLLEQLAPFADRVCVEGIGAAVTGSVSWYLAMLARCVGRVDDAERHEAAAARAHRDLGLVGDPPPLTDRTASRSAPTAAVSRARPESASMTDDGATWTVVFAGEARTLRDSKGLRDLAVLVARPGQDVHCLELVGAGVVAGETGPALDDRARRAYEQRIRDLHDDIEEARATNDLARAEGAEVELDALVEQLSAAFGLAGRARVQGSPAERARTTVTSRIRAAIRQAEPVHPALAHHLRHAVRTGTWCSYRPETPVAWTVTARRR